MGDEMMEGRQEMRRAVRLRQWTRHRDRVFVSELKKTFGSTAPEWGMGAERCADEVSGDRENRGRVREKTERSGRGNSRVGCGDHDVTDATGRCLGIRSQPSDKKF